MSTGHGSGARRYLAALKERDFRNLFIGASASSLGDGMSFVALAWLLVSRPHGVEQLGVFAVCYTAPVCVGGWLAGDLLDRFDKRWVLAIDSLIRGTAFALIPITQLGGQTPNWLIFAVAALYGLLKMVPLAGFPSSLPELVRDENLDAANGLEGLSYGIAGILGPLVAGGLIARVGATNVVLLDAVSYFVFAGLALSITRPLKSQRQKGVTPGLKTILTQLAADVPIVSTTIAFMAFNIAEGMLLVTAPWLAHERLGGATSLGLMLSALSVGELIGAAVAGGWSLRRSLLGIGIVQMIASLGFVSLFASSLKALVVAGFATIGLFSSPMTVWAQSMRMRRLPPNFRGRAFATLRTFMQATPPIGAAIAAPLLASGNLQLAVATMTLLASLPAVCLIVLGSVVGQWPLPATL